ncbi:MAG: cohesin domain-containing protein [Proteobacteria bacterium]|nr:cohesin domain-containing protein [Pseudomonadota bacterium]
MKNKWVIALSVFFFASFCLTVPGWAKGPAKQKQATTCTGPTITVGTVSVCTAGSSVELPITINDTAGQSSCTFSVSFDNTKLQYTGKTSGTMGAGLLLGSNSDINAAGMVQPIVTFEDGGPTSGTISKFKFTLLSAISEGAKIDLNISDINSNTPGTFCGESGAVQCGTSGPQTWDDVINIYQDYTNGLVTWEEVIAAYQAYANQ